MSHFDHLLLNVPRLWEKKWDQEIDAAEGTEKQLLMLRAKAAALLQGVDVSTQLPRGLLGSAFGQNRLPLLTAAE